MSNRTKTLINASGVVIVKVRIVDNDGDSSIQKGRAWGENVKSQFPILFDHAIYNAIYSHYSRFGFTELKSDEYDIVDFTDSVTVLDYYIQYGDVNEKYSISRDKERVFLRDKKGQLKYSTPYEDARSNRKKVNDYYNFEKKSRKKKTPNTSSKVTTAKNFEGNKKDVKKLQREQIKRVKKEQQELKIK